MSNQLIVGARLKLKKAGDLGLITYTENPPHPLPYTLLPHPPTHPPSS